MNRVIRMTLLLIFRPKRLKNNIYFALNSNSGTSAHIEHLLSLILLCIIQSFFKDFFFSPKVRNTSGVTVLNLFSSPVLGPADNKANEKIVILLLFCSIFDCDCVKCKKSIKEFRYCGTKHESPPTCLESQEISNSMFTFSFNHIEIKM